MKESNLYLLRLMTTYSARVGLQKDISEQFEQSPVDWQRILVLYPDLSQRITEDDEEYFLFTTIYKVAQINSGVEVSLSEIKDLLVLASKKRENYNDLFIKVKHQVELLG